MPPRRKARSEEKEEPPTPTRISARQQERAKKKAADDSSLDDHKSKKTKLPSVTKTVQRRKKLLPPLHDINEETDVPQEKERQPSISDEGNNDDTKKISSDEKKSGDDEKEEASTADDENKNENSNKETTDDDSYVPSIADADVDDADVDAVLDDSFFSTDEFLAVVDSFGDTGDDNDNTIRIGKKKPVKGRDDDPPPTKPDVAGLTKKEADEELIAWKKQRKAWYDRRRKMKLENNSLLADSIDYGGDLTSSIRIMTTVESRRLRVCDNFPTKEIAQIRIAEEANLKGLTVTTLRSDNTQVIVVGHNFYVKENNTTKKGWVVTKRVIDDGDGPIPMNEKTRKWMETHSHLLTPVKDDLPPSQVLALKGDEDDNDDELEDDSDDESESTEEKKSITRKSRSPFKAEWISPLIRAVVANTPKAPISVLKLALAPYLQDYAMTKTLVQNARRLARRDVFGNPDVNAKYILALRDEMDKLGHPVEVIGMTREYAINRLMLAVLTEKVCYLSHVRCLLSIVTMLVYD